MRKGNRQRERLVYKGRGPDSGVLHILLTEQNAVCNSPRAHESHCLHTRWSPSRTPRPRWKQGPAQGCASCEGLSTHSEIADDHLGKMLMTPQRCSRTLCHRRCLSVSEASPEFSHIQRAMAAAGMPLPSLASSPLFPIRAAVVQLRASPCFDCP